MPVVKEKRYGYRKGLYAVDKSPLWSHRYKKFDVVNAETLEIVIATIPDWDTACRAADRLNGIDPSPHVDSKEQTTRPKDGDSLPQIRHCGGDPF